MIEPWWSWECPGASLLLWSVWAHVFHLSLNLILLIHGISHLHSPHSQSIQNRFCHFPNTSLFPIPRIQIAKVTTISEHLVCGRHCTMLHRLSDVRFKVFYKLGYIISLLCKQGNQDLYRLITSPDN